MIPRSFALKWPWTPVALVQAEKFLGEVARSAARFRSGTYTGNGVAGLVLPLGMKAELILIHPATIGGSTPTTAALAMRHTANVTYVFSSGNVSGAVTEWTDTGILLGTHAAVNQAGQSYGYLALG